MKLAYFYILSALIFNTAKGQDSTAYYSLDDCIEYAFKNQVSVANAQLDVEMARAKSNEILAIGLPQVNGTGSIVDNPQLKRMFFEATRENTFTEPLIAQGVVNEGDVVSFENFFQLRTSGDVSATVNQLIFDGSYFLGVKASKTYIELSQRNHLKSKIETVEAVSKAYYLVLINKERLGLLDANVSRLDSMLRETKALYKEGFVEKIDVDRLEVNFNNLRTEKSKVINLYQLSQILLKFQMGMPIHEELMLEGDISEIKAANFSGPADQNIDYSSRIEYGIMQTDLELKKLDLKNKQAQYLPRLSAFATGGYFSQSIGLGDIFSSDWFGYSMYGLNLSVPIFDGFEKANKVKQARLEIQKSENSLMNFENTIAYQVNQSKFNLENNLKTLETLESNVELAKEVARIARVKFEEGVGSNLELVNAETDYKEAQTNYFNALYDVVVSEIDYKKSLGTLYSE